MKGQNHNATALAALQQMEGKVVALVTQDEQAMLDLYRSFDKGDKDKAKLGMLLFKGFRVVTK